MNINNIKAIINQKASNVSSYQTDGSAIRSNQQKIKEPISTISGQQQQPKTVNPTNVINPHQELVQFVKTNLIEGTDFGKIPGIPGNCLFKRGALKILRYLHCTFDVEMLDKTVDAKNSFFSYTVKVNVVSSENKILSSSLASANSYEKKFLKAGADADNNIINMASKRALVSCVKSML